MHIFIFLTMLAVSTPVRGEVLNQPAASPGDGKTIEQLHLELQALQAQLKQPNGAVDGRTSDKAKLRTALKANERAARGHYTRLRSHLRDLEQQELQHREQGASQGGNTDSLAGQIGETKKQINAILLDYPKFFGGPLQRVGNILHRGQRAEPVPPPAMR